MRQILRRTLFAPLLFASTKYTLQHIIPLQCNMESLRLQVVTFLPTNLSSSSNKCCNLPCNVTITQPQIHSTNHLKQDTQTRREVICKSTLSTLASLLILPLKPASAFTFCKCYSDLSHRISPEKNCGGIRIFGLHFESFPLFPAGPKEWLREQKKKTARFLLAPIAASRNYLNDAYTILRESGDIDPESKNGQKAESLVKSAARDCIPLEPGSFVSFQASSGVEVCTFRLILKNAAGLLSDSDPVKLRADVALDDLIRSFNELNELVQSYGPASQSYSKKVGGAFEGTMIALDKFESSIKDCLGI